MQDKINKLKEFHNTFGIGSQSPDLRYRLMKEENEEYLAAALSKDEVEIADALGDQLYVLCGTIITHNMEHIIDKVFDEIHRSNMTKLDKDGKPVINGKNGIFKEDKPLGKIIKSERFEEPKIKKIIDESNKEREDNHNQ